MRNKLTIIFIVFSAIILLIVYSMRQTYPNINDKTELEYLIYKHTEDELKAMIMSGELDTKALMKPLTSEEMETVVEWLLGLREGK